MSLSQPTAREPIHCRTIECRGYQRADGLWDIEGHLTDTKSYAFNNKERGVVEPGTPVHEMWLRLTLDNSLTVQGVEAATTAAPYGMCGDIIPAFQSLVGLKIKAGFTAAVRDRLGGTKGCVHLVEMLGPLATVAIQTIMPVRAKAESAKDPAKQQRPPLDTCHALRSDGPIIRRDSPAYYTGPDI